MALPSPEFFARPAVKLTGIGLLLALMLLPAALVSGVIDEREARQSEAQSEIARSWGPAQSVLGPILVVPYRALEPQPDLPNGERRPPTVLRGYVHVVPARLALNAALAPERRKRGLFGAVVYTADITIEGSFAAPALAVPDHPEAEFAWADASIVMGATDLRSASVDTRLVWGGTALPQANDPPAGSGCETMAFMRWALPAALAPGQSVPFQVGFGLRGTQGFHLVPAARDAMMHVSAPWPTPSFNGAVLPAQSDVTATGFTADWRDGGGARQAVWYGPRPMTCWGAASAVAAAAQQDGVDLLESVPTYRMVNRAAKYETLFLALGFLTYFLFEMLSRVRIHAMQYGLLGLSLTLFPLLLLAVAEPAGFGLAYLVASGAVLLQASLHTWAVTRRVPLALTFAGVLAGLFGFLYVVLSLESYALLSGAVALFTVLSVVMAVTARMDWGTPAKPASP